MKIFFWPRDTIAWRFGMTIVASMVAACCMIALFFAFGGVWARPPMDAAARLEGAMAIVHIIEAAPEQMRAVLAASGATRTYRVNWYGPTASVSLWLDGMSDTQEFQALSQEIKAVTERFQRTIVLITPENAITTSPEFPLRSTEAPGVYFFCVKLSDGSWIVFTGFARYWGISQSQRLQVWLVFFLLSFGAVSTFATRRLSRPIKQFAKAVRLSGANSQTAPIPEHGPQELKELISAFNGMQKRIGDFIAHRTAMLAAISHDLRTPLTRIRLRGEYIEDTKQQTRLFRDVDEMQAMIDGVLAFFRGDEETEPMRTFDLAGIVQSIVDDYADQGIELRYHGPNHLTYTGRHIALKRALTNLVENAVNYATPPSLALSCVDETMIITVRDHGPGIPKDEMEHVFKPFYRLNTARKKSIRGVGLGLTSAQAILRGHGGEITVANHPKGGLEVTVTLPRIV